MAVKSYVGVSDVAKEVTKAYIGVNDVARKVNKIYTGVNGVAELVYESAPPVEIVTWSGGTDAQIVAMVEAADAGLINLSDYWSVGDTRTVNLSAMSATGVGESHEAQSVEFVLMNEGGKTLANATASGRTTCSFVVGMKNSLKEAGYIYSATGSNLSWYNSPRRTWCNNTFKNSIPSTLRSIFKQHYNDVVYSITNYNVRTETDYFSLFCAEEVTGTSPFPNSAKEGNHITWYETPANRIKTLNGTSDYWWNRSASFTNNNSPTFARIDSEGNLNLSNANTDRGLSPFGVI